MACTTASPKIIGRDRYGRPILSTGLVRGECDDHLRPVRDSFGPLVWESDSARRPAPSQSPAVGLRGWPAPAGGPGAGAAPRRCVSGLALGLGLYALGVATKARGRPLRRAGMAVAGADLGWKAGATAVCGENRPGATIGAAVGGVVGFLLGGGKV